MGFDKILPLSLLVILFLLSGCIEEVAISDRLLCLDLTSYSNAKIPKCNSQEECFSLVEKNFSFEDELFSSSVRQALHQYKNHIARSWLYYNRAMKNIKSIYNICFNSKNLSGITPLVNELNHNLIQAFSEADSGAKVSFSIIVLEKADLEREGVGLMKEETLFNDYIILNDNINELALPQRAEKNSNSYVSFYFSRANSFNNLSSELYFQPIILQQFSPYDLIKIYDKQLLDSVPKTEFYIPLLADSIQKLVRYVSNLYDLRQAVAALQHFPSFELLSSFNDFVGTENSAVVKFATLMNSDNGHRRELVERNKGLKGKIQAELVKIDNKIKSLDPTYYASFDRNFLTELYALLGQETQIATQQYSIEDISIFKGEAIKEQFILKQKEQQIRDEEFLGKISLGRKTNELKKLYSAVLLLNDKIDFFHEEVVAGLNTLCDSRVLFIERELEEIKLPEEQILKVADLKARLSYKINKFKSLTDARGRLLLCSPIVEEYNSFKGALIDLENYEIELGEEIDDCLNYLEDIFSISKIDLSNYRSRFSKLQLLEKPYVNPSSVVSSCTYLREDVDSFLNSDELIAKIRLNHLNSRKLLCDLDTLSQTFPDLIESSTFSDLKKKFLAEEEFFNGEKINLLKALPATNELNLSSERLLNELNTKFREAIKTYLEKNAKIDFSSSVVPELDKEYNSKMKITLTNSLREINSPLELELPLPQGIPIKLVYSTPNIGNVFLDGKELIINLSNLPLGPTILIFDSNSILASSEESTNILFIDSEKALFEKEITILTKGNLPELKIKLENAATWNDVFIYSKGKQINFYRSGDNLVFFLKNVKNNQLVQIYYSFPKPIGYSIELISQKQIDLNTIQYNYAIEIKNNLDMSTTQNTRITPPFPLGAENTIQEIKLFTSKGKKLDLSILQLNKISFSLPSLPPKQLAELHLSLTVKDYTNYWNSILGRYEQELNYLSSSINREIKEEAENLLKELNELEQRVDLKSQSELNQIILLREKINRLKGEQEQLVKYSNQYILIKGEVESDLNSLKNDIDSLRNYGFDHYADSLQLMQDKAKSYLLEANSSNSSNDKNSVLSLLFNAKAVLSEKPSTDITATMVTEKNNLMGNAREFFSIVQEHNLKDKNFLELREHIFSLDREMDSALMSKDLAKAKKSLDLLGRKVADYNTSINYSLKNKVSKIKDDIDSFNLFTDKLIPDKIASLVSLLEGIDEEELHRIGYVPPITKEELNKIKLQSENLKDVLLKEKFNPFLKYSREGDYNKALSEAKGFEKELKNYLGNAESISSLLEKKENKLGEDAIIAFNSAIIKLKNSSPSAQAEEFLSMAKAELEEKNYLKAIELSNKVGSALSFNNPKDGFSIPLAIYPFLLIIGVALFFKFRKNQNKRQQTRLQKILRNR